MGLRRSLALLCLILSTLTFSNSIATAQIAVPYAAPPVIAIPTPPGQWMLCQRPYAAGRILFGPIWVWIPQQQQPMTPAPQWCPQPLPSPTPPATPPATTPAPLAPPLEMKTPPAISNDFPAIKPITTTSLPR